MILGYGVAGPDEPRIEATLKRASELCDRIIIVSNNSNQKDIIRKYAAIHEDTREWGKFQNRIKEDFVKNFVPRLRPDACLCFDMDEIFDPRLTKEYLEQFPHHAAYFFFVDLWDDEEHYNPNLNFWNVRFWKYDPQLSLDFYPQPLHCGLAPKIFYTLGRRVPYIVRHYGLINREKKIARYDKYDSKAQYKGQVYYDELRYGKGIPYNETEMIQKVEEFVDTYKDKVKPIIPMPNQKFFYVQNNKGNIVDIPERDLERTLKREGFTLIGEVGVSVPVRTEAPVVETKSLKCEICGFEAVSRLGLGAHQRKHK